MSSARTGSTPTEVAYQRVIALVEPDAVESIRSMKLRAEALAESAAREEIKKGVGGIRDIEFSVQLLQLATGNQTIPYEQLDRIFNPPIQRQDRVLSHRSI